MAKKLEREHIRNLALREGFDVCELVSLSDVPDCSGEMGAFIEAGYHGDMDWLERTAGVRGHPTRLWGAAKSAIVLGMNYGPEGDPLGILEKKDCGAISVYAQGDDYHDVVKKALKRLARAIICEDMEVKVFVDTAPIMEKPLAEAAGLGWQGKHSNLVSRELGSWLFLGSILTSFEYGESAPEPIDHCGSCRACLDICPTDAFPKPYQLDARKCISYLTIEHKGHIDEVFRKPMGNRIYGCDDCLAVCPWNKYAEVASESKYHARSALKAPALAELVMLDDGGFRKLFSKSPIKRIGWVRFIRNVLIAIGNSGNGELVPLVKKHLGSPEPLIRAMAVWALRCLDEGEWRGLAGEAVGKEKDEQVRREWV